MPDFCLYLYCVRLCAACDSKKLLSLLSIKSKFILYTINILNTVQISYKIGDILITKTTQKLKPILLNLQTAHPLEFEFESTSFFQR